MGMEKHILVIKKLQMSNNLEEILENNSPGKK